MEKLNKPERLCILTDSIYAIVLTLLVLDLKPPAIPGMTDRQLMDDLFHQLPNFKAYIVSFVILARFWLRHDAIFKTLQQIDRRILILNFLHILFISLIPFTASLIGHYQKDEVAIVIFIFDISLCGFFLSMIRQHVSRHKEWLDRSDAKRWIVEPWYIRYSFSMIALSAIAVSLLKLRDIALFICFSAPFIASYLSRRYESGAQKA